MPYQLPQAQNLDAILQMNPFAFNQAQQMQEGGIAQNDADLKKAQLANLFDEQNDPLRVQHQQKLNDQLDANLPGLQAISQQQQLRTQRDQAGQGDAIELARKKFLKEASDADIDMLGNEAQRMAYSSDPQQQAHGVALMRMHKDMVKERDKQAAESQRQLAGIRESGNQSRLTQNDAIAAGKFKKAGSGAKNVEEQIISGKLTFEKGASMFAGMAFLAKENGDDELADKYNEMADKYNRKALDKAAAGVNAGAESKPDLRPLGIKPNEAKPVESFGGTKKTAPASDEASFKAAFGAYEPDKYEYRINPDTGKPQRKAK